MIRIGDHPDGLTVCEIAKCIKHMQERYPDIRSGRLDIEIIGDEIDMILTEDAPPPFQRIRRITGYLTGDVRRWNDGKYAELKDRVTHGV